MPKKTEVSHEKTSQEASRQEASTESTEGASDQTNGAEPVVREPEETEASEILLNKQPPKLKISMPIVYRDINDTLLPGLIFSHSAETATLIVFNNAGHSIALNKVPRGVRVGEFWHDEDVLRAAILLEKD